MKWENVFEKVGDGFTTTLDVVNRGLMRIFGDSNVREVRRLQPKVNAINALEPKMQALTDTELKELTVQFRRRLSQGETLDGLLVEAFAACREAGRRFLNMRHYDVQLIGGMVLHSGKIAEMVTGEGKTLVATLPAYLNALAGRGVHVVTVNDYLARRDAEWMSRLYNGLGLTVDAIQSSINPNNRQHIYACDITYGTNNEFGFDYLRDNMKPRKDYQAQRGLFYAIIDEVDSILIDEARTPLIISGAAHDDPEKYRRADQIARQLKRGTDFEVNEKDHSTHLTDDGVLHAEKLANVESFYTAGNMQWPHLIDNALKAHHLYHRGKQYMVRGEEVVIVDEHTGRAMEGRQWSDGLHQAVEAKEGVRIKQETQTLATITFQNFFKLYNKISGMTGTAMTEANELWKIYKLDVVAIPTNRPLQRVNFPDVIYGTEKEKWDAVVREVKTVTKTGRPVLVGTTSDLNSEKLSKLFTKSGIKHELLNAKYVEREADIVAQAGRRGAVTISTNMAGRGTDIILGGNPEAMAWAQLKKQYPTRLEVPADVWQQTITPLLEPMKREGEEIKKLVLLEELAKHLSTKDDLSKIIEAARGASDEDIYEVEKLAKRFGIKDERALEQLLDLKRCARPGGLHIIGTERHDSRRIDNQLRGRAGRQGDPGSSRFFLSLEDDLMRRFAGDWVRGFLQWAGMKDGVPIESPMVSRRITAAQKKVEERNFEARKNLLEYDEIMDVQRKQVYGYRQAILEGGECKQLILKMLDEAIEANVARVMERDYPVKVFTAWASARLGVQLRERDYRRATYEEAVAQAKTSAVQIAEQNVYEKIEENLNQEEDESEWKWEALAQWATGVHNVKVRAADLRQLGRENVETMLNERIRSRIEAVDLADAEFFFRPDFCLQQVLGWANHTFNASIDAEEVPEAVRNEPVAMSQWLKERVREIYRRKEIEFPVISGLSRFMVDKSINPNSRYDRDGLVAWASSRFETALDRAEYSDLTRTETMAKLVAASDKYFRDGAWEAELEAKLAAAFGNQERVSRDQIADFAAWLDDTYDGKLDLKPLFVDRARIREQAFAAAESKYRPELREVERTLLLQFLDMGWKDHLYAMDHLRNTIGLIGYAQVDPKVEYKRVGRQIFHQLWDNLAQHTTENIFRIEQVDPSFVSSIWHITNATHQAYQPPAEQSEIGRQQEEAIQNGQAPAPVEPIRNRQTKIGRNDPCPCNSGKKYKQCCMAKDQARGVA